MDRSTLLAALRAICALLLVVGLAGVAVGGYSVATYDCETTYYYQAQPVTLGEATAEPVAFADLSDAEKRTFRAALNDSSNVGGPVSQSGRLGGAVVEYRGEHYRVLSSHGDCPGPWGVAFALFGAPVALVGLVGLVPAHLLLRRSSN